MANYLDYSNTEVSNVRELINVYRNRSRLYAEQDEDYNEVIKESMKDADLHTIDDCVKFFQDWFNIYNEVKNYWSEEYE